MPKFNSIKKICSSCNKPFWVQPHRLLENRGKYCSPECYQAARNAPIFKKCKICGKEFKSFICLPNNKYCSKKCSDKSRTKIHIKKNGYLLVYKPDHPRTRVGNNGKYGYVLEHIIIVEKHLKKLLNDKEVIHHINENRADNRLENLYLFPSNSAHSKYHKLFRLGKCDKITKSNLT